MFVRNLSMHLRPNSLAAFNKAFADVVLPDLRKQPGFVDELAFVNDNYNHITAISLWESRETADAYQASGHAFAMAALEKVIAGDAKTRTSSVVSCTIRECEKTAV